MDPRWRFLIIGLVLVGAGGALLIKRSGIETEVPIAAPVLTRMAAPPEPTPPTYESTQPGLPRLVAVGAGECIPCRAMAPIRADLRRDYAGSLVVDFYDVWKDRQAGHHFGIQVIPTLIYYDASGVELGRQEGYVPKAQILATLGRLGVVLPGRG
jgi:thioredoxin 1